MSSISEGVPPGPPRFPSDAERPTGGKSRSTKIDTKSPTTAGVNGSSGAASQVVGVDEKQAVASSAQVESVTKVNNVDKVQPERTVSVDSVGEFPPAKVSKPLPRRRGVVDLAKNEAGTAKTIALEAVSSGAWAYPVYGVTYIVTHPSLIVPVLPLLLRALLVSAAVVAGCFFFLYIPQVAWLALFSGPLAFGLAVPVVLAEASLIIVFLGKNYLLGPLGTDLFDAVLVQKGHEQLVRKARPITTTNKSKQLGRLIKAPFSKLSTDNILRSLLTLPLNFIPVVGTVFFLGYNGYKSGPSYHARYFQLKGFDKDRRAAFIQRRRGAYTAFGIVAMVFNMVPVVSILLGLASHVGAALWAANIESKDGQKEEVADVSLPARN